LVASPLTARLMSSRGVGHGMRMRVAGELVEARVYRECEAKLEVNRASQCWS
jgi:hypothetical protein